jgi:hypothetical protein
MTPSRTQSTTHERQRTEPSERPQGSPETNSDGETAEAPEAPRRLPGPTPSEDALRALVAAGYGTLPEELEW